MVNIEQKVYEFADNLAIKSGIVQQVDENGRPIKQRKPRRPRQVNNKFPRISHRTPRLR